LPRRLTGVRLSGRFPPPCPTGWRWFLVRAGCTRPLRTLISRLFHADVFITEQAERIDALEAEITRLEKELGDKVTGGRMSGRRHQTLERREPAAPGLQGG
jgi:hypothetical protein